MTEIDFPNCQLKITSDSGKEGKESVIIGTDGISNGIKITNDITALTETTTDLRKSSMYLITALKGEGMFPQQVGAINMTANNYESPLITLNQLDQVSVKPADATCAIRANTIQLSQLQEDFTTNNSTYATGEAIISKLNNQQTTRITPLSMTMIDLEAPLESTLTNEGLIINNTTLTQSTTLSYDTLNFTTTIAEPPSSTSLLITEKHISINGDQGTSSQYVGNSVATGELEWRNLPTPSVPTLQAVFDATTSTATSSYNVIFSDPLVATNTISPTGFIISTNDDPPVLQSILNGTTLSLYDNTGENYLQVAPTDIVFNNGLNNTHYTPTSITTTQNSFDISANEIKLNSTALKINGSYGTTGQIIKRTTANNYEWADFPNTYPQIVVIDLSANYTITGITNSNYILWCPTSTAGQQSVFLPTSNLTLGQSVTIRNDADSLMLNAGTNNLIYSGATPLQTLTVSANSARQLVLSRITGSVYNWIISSTS